MNECEIESYHATLLARIEQDAAVIEAMTLAEITLGDGGFATSKAMSAAFDSGLMGVSLLIVLLLADKKSPADVWRLSGQSSTAFLGSVSELQKTGIFRFFYDDQSNNALPLLSDQPIFLNSRKLARLLAPILHKSEATLIRDISRSPESLPPSAKNMPTRRGKLWRTSDVYTWLGVKA